MVNINSKKTEKGKIGEKIAKNYLQSLGYTFIEQNYYYNHGEIDLIYKDNSEIVFIEVKFRKSEFLGNPLEAITQRKQNLIRRTAEGFVLSKKISNTPCRFDAISIIDLKPKPKITHFKNAF